MCECVYIISARSGMHVCVSVSVWGCGGVERGREGELPHVLIKYLIC